jgi:hypothetical protein
MQFNDGENTIYIALYSSTRSRTYCDQVQLEWLNCYTRWHLVGFVTAIRACGLAGSSVAKGLTKIGYKGYRFPPEIIQQAIGLSPVHQLSRRRGFVG